MPINAINTMAMATLMKSRIEFMTPHKTLWFKSDELPPYFLAILSLFMHRRRFLTAMGVLSLAALAGGCQTAPTNNLRIATLEGSIPPQLIQAFKRQLNQEQGVSIFPTDSLIELYETLQGWQQQTQNEGASASPLQPVSHWLTLGDYWLKPAIQHGLIRPVDVSNLEYWADLPEPWITLLRRDSTGALADTGEIWGVPYRWSNLAILYNPERVSKETSITRWEDLLSPELSRRLILPDHPRLVIGLGLKAMGTSANVEDPAQVPGLVEFLRALHQQVRIYSSDRYLETLIIGDASAVVGWGEDMQPVLQQYRQFSGVVPEPGTLIGADLWVQPKTAPELAFDSRWLDFCLSPDFADLLASYDQGVAPCWLGLPSDQLPAALQQNSLLTMEQQVVAESDFLLPLSEAANARYLELWESLRSLV
jgi:putative spermidine/putrescine transport system substrate-binding protein